MGGYGRVGVIKIPGHVHAPFFEGWGPFDRVWEKFERDCEEV